MTISLKQLKLKLHKLIKEREFTKAVELLKPNLRKFNDAILYYRYAAYIRLVDEDGYELVKDDSIKQCLLRSIALQKDYLPSYIELAYYYYAHEDDWEKAKSIFDLALEENMKIMAEIMIGLKSCLEDKEFCADNDEFYISVDEFFELEKENFIKKIKEKLEEGYAWHRELESEADDIIFKKVLFKNNGEPFVVLERNDNPSKK